MKFFLLKNIKIKYKIKLKFTFLKFILIKMNTNKIFKTFKIFKIVIYIILIINSKANIL